MKNENQNVNVRVISFGSKEWDDITKILGYKNRKGRKSKKFKIELRNCRITDKVENTFGILMDLSEKKEKGCSESRRMILQTGKGTHIKELPTYHELKEKRIKITIEEEY